MRSMAEFAVAAGLLTLIPGPDTLLTLRTAISCGRAEAVAAALGISTALLGWGCAAGLGLTGALAASPTLYLALRYVGVAYLMFLGLRAIAVGASWPVGQLAADTAQSLPLRHSYLRGLVVCASNPKVGIFYLALFPQFIRSGAGVLADSMQLAAIHATETMTWLMIVTAVATRLGRLLRRRAPRRWVDRFAGAAFLAFAARLAAGG